MILLYKFSIYIVKGANCFATLVLGFSLIREKKDITLLRSPKTSHVDSLNHVKRSGNPLQTSTTPEVFSFPFFKKKIFNPSG